MDTNNSWIHKIEYDETNPSRRHEINYRALFSDETKEYVCPPEPEEHEEIEIRFRTAKDNIDQVIMCTELCAEESEYIMEKVESDNLFDYYAVKVNVGAEEFRYYFKIMLGEDVVYYDKTGCKEAPADSVFRILPGFKTPDWAKGAVMYQIYTDRFYNGDKSNDVLSGEYAYIGEHVRKENDWYAYPDAMDVRTFYGGDLAGVIEKLPYLQKLGVQAIYFNPLFVSPSNHKYDIQDYDNIDPHIGKIVVDEGELLAPEDKLNQHATKYISRVSRKENLDASNEFFAELVKKAHEIGIRVIIDGVFNHCGSFNKWLDREKIYEDAIGYESGAYADKESVYNKYFKFEEDAWPENKSYEGWWNHETLPKLNYEDSKELEDYIMYIAKKWVSPPYNADGWRLDVAADLGHGSEYNHYFWKRFRDTVKSANPEAIIIAEHYGNPDEWLNGKEWDTVMNYDAFMEPATWFFTGMEKHSDARSDYMEGDSVKFVNAMKLHMSRFTMPSLYTAMNQLSNHDHSRFMTRTNRTVGRTSTLGAEAANEGIRKAVMKEAVVMQMTWPGAPTLYYGDEAGMCGWTDPDNRRAYPWGKEDLELIEFHRDIIHIHRSNPALCVGSLKLLFNEHDLLAYGRFTNDSKLVIVINNDEIPRDLSVNLWEIGIENTDRLQRIMLTSENCYNPGALNIEMPEGNEPLQIQIPGKAAAIYRMRRRK